MIVRLSFILLLYLAFHILYKVSCIYIIYIIQLETVQRLYYSVKMLTANFLHFTFCMMNIQCFTFRLNSQSTQNAALLDISSLYIHNEAPTPHVFGFLPVKTRRNLRLSVNNEGIAMDIKRSCLFLSVMLHSCIRLAFMPSYKMSYDYQPHCFRKQHKPISSSSTCFGNTRHWWHVASHYANHQS